MVILVMTLAVAGSSCALRHSYPVLKPPEPPKGILVKEGDRWFITRPNLIRLNAYVDALLDQNKKYRREIKRINGD